MKPTDLVYVLGTGSSWDNNEIRYSLRSIEKNLKHYGKVFIVGECPAWVKNVVHIPHPDDFGTSNADGNMINKILEACCFSSLSNRFLLMSDDELIIKPVSASEIPYYHKGDMSQFDASYFEHNEWRKRLGNTAAILKKEGHTAFHFDCHMPMLIDKQKFVDVMMKYNYQEGIGYTKKSLYANTVGVDPVKLPNMKYTIFKHYNLKEIKKRLTGWKFMNMNDTGLNDDLKKWLSENFPDKSNYEL